MLRFRECGGGNRRAAARPHLSSTASRFSCLRPAAFSANCFCSSSLWLGFACGWMSEPCSYASHAKSCVCASATASPLMRAKLSPAYTRSAASSCGVGFSRIERVLGS